MDTEVLYTNDNAQTVRSTIYKRVAFIIGLSVVLSITVALTIPLCMRHGCWRDEDDGEAGTIPPISTTSSPSTTPSSTYTTASTPGTTTTATQAPPTGIRDVTVSTTSGPITGHLIEVTSRGHESVPIHSYLGVPYAKPPIGSLRWQKPQPPDPWTEPLAADKLRSLCPQNNITVQVTHLGWDDFSEDCLYINIYTPAESSGEPYPVMFFIHGGMWTLWGNILFPGHFLAQRGVVVVSINYRLGLLGFLSTDEPERHSNYGLWDQLQALKWVNENIRNFGGDPNKITVFGESVGGASCGLMMVSPQTDGLFQQAILQSGGDLHHFAVSLPGNHQEMNVYDVASQLLCPTEDNEQMIECLRGIDPQTLRATVPQNNPHYRPFRPVVDGDDGFLPMFPRDLRHQRLVKPRPMMIGTNKDESNIMILQHEPSLLIRNINRTEFENGVRRAIEQFGYVVSQEDVDEELYQAVRWFYSPWPVIDDKDENRLAICQVLTDRDFVAATTETVARHSEKGDVYEYVLDVRYNLQLGSGILPSWLGVPHMWDLPFVFGYPQIQFADEELQRDTGYLNIPAMRFSRSDEDWSDYIITLWTNFAKFGDPTPDNAIPTPPGSVQPLKWSKATPTQHNYLYLENTETSLRQNYRSLASSFWTNYFFTMAQGWDLHTNLIPEKDITDLGEQFTSHFNSPEDLTSIVELLKNGSPNDDH